MLAACSGELEQILEQGDKFIFAFAIGQEEREENGEIASTDEDFFSDLFGELTGQFCTF